MTTPTAPLVPPSGGNWIAEADGTFTPADASTANSAGIPWPLGTVPTPTPDPVDPAQPE